MRWARSSIVDTKSIMLQAVARGACVRKLPVKDIPSSSERLVLECMAYAGLRLGKAFAMRREHLNSDLNSDRMSYFVAQSYKRQTFSLPKAGKTRLVDLTDFLVQSLLSHIERLKLDYRLAS